MTSVKDEFEFPQKHLEVDGHRLAYADRGSGDYLVLLHAGGLGASAADNFARNFFALSEEFHVLAPDFPGFGKSDLPIIKEGRVALYSGIVVDWLKRLGVSKAHFLGTSMGATVALSIAARYPEIANRIVVIGPAGISETNTFFSARPSEGIRSIIQAVINPSKETFARMMENFVQDKKILSQDLIEYRWRGITPEHVKSRQTFIIEDIAQQLPKVKSPTLVVHGAEDRVAPLEVPLILLRSIPEAQLHIFSNSGHWVQYEKSDKFNRLVRSFLSEK
jgi:4,5:9,10-diseco-3-hydroxy-5,9,17-trioxoandrosta-1(10),2-diene-4-oate hydrolase